LEPAKILIADDEAHIRHILRNKLEAAGFSVSVAQDGREALSIALEVLPDLLITDLQMPEMTGLELCHSLRDEPTTAGIPAIMLTSRGDVLTDDQKSRARIARLIDKPFSPRLLLATIQEVLKETQRSQAA
jgi:DNA-binding response OmpR family regulator